MRVFVGSVVAVLLIGATPARATGDSNPKIVPVGKSLILASPEPKSETAKVTLTLLNTGKGNPSIDIALEAPSSGKVSVLNYEPKQLAPNAATRVKVTLQGLGTLKDKPVEGQLVVTGGAEPIALTVSMKKPLQPSKDWPASIFLWAGFACAFAIAAVVLWALIATLTSGPMDAAKTPLQDLLGPAPGPRWSSSSWATTLTAVGGILGTTLTSIAFPEVPRQIEKNTLVQLNLAFTVLLVVGPFFFQAIRNPTTKADEQGLWGFSPALLVSYGLIFGAVIGELASLALLGTEVAGTEPAEIAVVVIICVLAVLAAYYFVVTAYYQVTTDWKDQATKAREASKAPRKVIVVDAPPDSGDEPSTKLLAMLAPAQLHARMP